MKLVDLSTFTLVLVICGYGSHALSEQSRDEAKLVHQLFLMHTYDPMDTTETISYFPFGKSGVTAVSTRTSNPIVKLDIEETEDRSCVYRVVSHVLRDDRRTYRTVHRFEIDGNEIDYASASVGSFQDLSQVKFKHRIHAMGDVLNNDPHEFVQDVLPSRVPSASPTQARVENWLKRMAEFQRRYCRGK